MKRLCYLILLVALLVTLSCKKEKEAVTPAAQVGSQILSLQSFRANFNDEQWNAMDDSQRKKYLEDWVNLTLLANEADALGLSDDLAIKLKMENAVKKVKANALIANRLSNIHIAEDELFNYYRLYQAEFKGKLLEYNVQRIYMKDQNAARELVNRLKGGLDFDEAVLTYSSEELGISLGKMGFVSATGADSLFWMQARKIKEGEISYFAADDGFYIIRYTGTQESNQDAGFEDFKSQIRERILAERHQQIYQDLLRQLKNKNHDIYYY